MGKDEFARRFFGRDAGDEVAQALHAAASGIASAESHGDLREASEQVANAMQKIGLDRWQRFLADAQTRADDPATMLAVAHSQPMPTLHFPMLDTKAAPPPVTRVADVTPPEAPATPAVAAEPEHGAIWRWLHGLGLTETRHEQATSLRRVMGSGGGLVYMRDGVPLNVDEMSDDEVLALNKETRGKPHGPPLIGAAAPIMTSWGWDKSPAYQDALKQLEQPGTHETLNGRIPTWQEAERMIKESGGEFLRMEPPHRVGRSTHNYHHINYLTSSQKAATVRVQPWKR